MNKIMPIKSNHPKIAIVNQIQHDFANTQFVIIGNYSQISVKQFQALRQLVNKNDGQLKIYKNKLLQLAWKKTPFMELNGKLIGPNCVVKSNNLGFEFFALLANFSKKFKNLKWHSGFWNGQVIDQSMILKLGQIPNRATLLQNLVLVLKSPLYHLQSTLKMITIKKQEIKN